MKPPLLYLVHRIPYPPNKGDKIRSYHVLEYLAQFYRIYLAAFVDDTNDWKYEKNLKQWCAETLLIPLNPTKAKIKSLTGFLTADALTLPYYRSRQLQVWVDTVIAKYGIKQAVVFSAAMAQFVSDYRYHRINRIIDFVDVDSDKWAQYSKTKNWPMNWLYARESQYLLKYEKKIAAQFNLSFFVSEAEAAHFKKLAPESESKIDYFSNGVDTDYFSPQHSFTSPYKQNEIAMVFTGAMDYWANVDAVQWFARAILPTILAKNSNVHFYIVGSNPTEQVQQLAKSANIVVTGRVADVRPYLKHARLSVAPLRISRGIQNKVLEAMSMECLVITTSLAAEGIDAQANTDLVIANNETEFAAACLNYIEHSDKGKIGATARNYVLTNYLWKDNLQKLQHCLEHPSHDAKLVMPTDIKRTGQNKSTQFL